MYLACHDVRWTFIGSGWAGLSAKLTVKKGAGEQTPLAFSLAYAAPETIEAYTAGEKQVIAYPTVDVWAVGVIAYGLLMREVFPPSISAGDVINALLGKAPLPWETATPAELKALGRLKGPVLQCLSREPEKRPTSADLLASLQRMLFSSNTTAASQ